MRLFLLTVFLAAACWMSAPYALAQELSKTEATSPSDAPEVRKQKVAKSISGALALPTKKADLEDSYSFSDAITAESTIDAGQEAVEQALESAANVGKQSLNKLSNTMPGISASSPGLKETFQKTGSNITKVKVLGGMVKAIDFAPAVGTFAGHFVEGEYEDAMTRGAQQTAKPLVVNTAAAGGALALSPFGPGGQIVGAAAGAYVGHAAWNQSGQFVEENILNLSYETMSTSAEFEGDTISQFTYEIGGNSTNTQHAIDNMVQASWGNLQSPDAPDGFTNSPSAHLSPQAKQANQLLELVYPSLAPADWNSHGRGTTPQKEESQTKQRESNLPETLQRESRTVISALQDEAKLEVDAAKERQKELLEAKRQQLARQRAAEVASYRKKLQQLQQQNQLRQAQMRQAQLRRAFQQLGQQIVQYQAAQASSRPQTQRPVSTRPPSAGGGFNLKEYLKAHGRDENWQRQHGFLK